MENGSASSLTQPLVSSQTTLHIAINNIVSNTQAPAADNANSPPPTPNNLSRTPLAELQLSYDIRRWQSAVAYTPLILGLFSAFDGRFQTHWRYAMAQDGSALALSFLASLTTKLNTRYQQSADERYTLRQAIKAALPELVISLLAIALFQGIACLTPAFLGSDYYSSHMKQTDSADLKSHEQGSHFYANGLALLVSLLANGSKYLLSYTLRKRVYITETPRRLLFASVSLLETALAFGLNGLMYQLASYFPENTLRSFTPLSDPHLADHGYYHFNRIGFGPANCQVNDSFNRLWFSEDCAVAAIASTAVFFLAKLMLVVVVATSPPFLPQQQQQRYFKSLAWLSLIAAGAALLTTATLRGTAHCNNPSAITCGIAIGIMAEWSAAQISILVCRPPNKATNITMHAMGTRKSNSQDSAASTTSAYTPRPGTDSHFTSPRLGLASPSTSPRQDMRNV